MMRFALLVILLVPLCSAQVRVIGSITELDADVTLISNALPVRTASYQGNLMILLF